uniref:Dipeptidylpeptidase IV N-terminal domain-containing protein n=1 Tax=Timema monikensis TaxID=170555 RepID=A0A7R9EG47_9NEOP|nr:unnamed protein product [Timema monikensis]
MSVSHSTTPWLENSGLTHHGTNKSCFTVPEEILKSSSALWFSPDGQYLLFASFNDTLVGELKYPWYGSLEVRLRYPQIRSIRYPKDFKKRELLTGHARAGVGKRCRSHSNFQSIAYENYIVTKRQAYFALFRYGAAYKREYKTPFGGKLSTPDRDLNLDLPVIGSLVHYESSALDHVATEECKNKLF